MLSKIKIFDQLEIKENGTIFVREIIQIKEGDVVLSSLIHRSCYIPGSDISKACEYVKKAAAVFWKK